MSFVFGAPSATFLLSPLSAIPFVAVPPVFLSETMSLDPPSDVIFAAESDVSEGDVADMIVLFGEVIFELN